MRRADFLLLFSILFVPYLCDATAIADEADRATDKITGAVNATICTATMSCIMYNGVMEKKCCNGNKQCCVKDPEGGDSCHVCMPNKDLCCPKGYCCKSMDDDAEIARYNWLYVLRLVIALTITFIYLIFAFFYCKRYGKWWSSSQTTISPVTLDYEDTIAAAIRDAEEQHQQQQQALEYRVSPPPSYDIKTASNDFPDFPVAVTSSAEVSQHSISPPPYSK